MIIQIILGVIAGTITGLIPGLHSNNVVYIFGLLSFFDQKIIYFVISMVITQSFVDFIPSIYFGAPDSSTFEGVLPGHKLFLNGKAHLGVILTIFGGIISIIFSILALIIFNQFLEINSDKIIYLIPPVLIFSILTLIFSEKELKKKIITIFVIIVAASQGFLFKDQIFPLISGYFGISTILLSNKKSNFIKQNNKIEFNKSYFKEGIIGLIGGSIVSIFPGIGNNLAAAIIKLFRSKISSEKYLVLLGSINTSNFIFSIPVLFILNRSRNGAAIFLQENFLVTSNTFFYILITILISASLASILTILISKNISKNLNKINLNITSKIVIIFIISSVFLLNGIIGLITLVFSTALGLFTITNKIRRSACLCALIIPVLFFYVFILI
jgi:putative membrane protein